MRNCNLNNFLKNKNHKNNGSAVYDNVGVCINLYRKPWNLEKELCIILVWQICDRYCKDTIIIALPQPSFPCSLKDVILGINTCQSYKYETTINIHSFRYEDIKRSKAFSDKNGHCYSLNKNITLCRLLIWINWLVFVLFL